MPLTLALTDFVGLVLDGVVVAEHGQSVRRRSPLLASDTRQYARLTLLTSLSWANGFSNLLVIKEESFDKSVATKRNEKSIGACFQTDRSVKMSLTTPLTCTVQSK